MKLLVSILAHTAATFFFIYGILFLINPLDWFYIVTNDLLKNPTSLIDIRSTYGGVNIAVAVFIRYLYLRSYKILCMNLISTILLIMASARILGMMIDGSGNWIMTVYLILELIGGGLALFAAKLLKSEIKN
ncbi:MAG: DUF4345 family protein [Kangiellaceae bacterium]